MIKYTTYRWAMGLCALLLVAAATPLSADFQNGIQGSSVHHREKRNPVIFMKAWIPTVRGSRLIPRRENPIPYGFYEGYFYTPRARKRILGDELGKSSPDERIPLEVADQIIKFGASSTFTGGFQVKQIKWLGTVVFQPTGMQRLPTVTNILPPHRTSGRFPAKD